MRKALRYLLILIPAKKLLFVKASLSFSCQSISHIVYPHMSRMAVAPVLTGFNIVTTLNMHKVNRETPRSVCVL